MTRKTIFQTSLVTAGALAATLFTGTAAQAAPPGEERRKPGMQRMHQLHMQGNPGMERMCQLHMQGNPGMQRMHQLHMQGGMHTGAMGG